MDFQQLSRVLLLAEQKNRRMKIDHHAAAVSDTAEKMIESLLKVDLTFFTEFRYDDASQGMRVPRTSIDKLL